MNVRRHLERTPTSVQSRDRGMLTASRTVQIPQVRGMEFYPNCLEKGCRSERALKLAIAEMYVMGVSSRKVTEITKELCGLDITSGQVSRLAKLLDEELELFGE